MLYNSLASLLFERIKKKNKEIFEWKGITELNLRGFSPPKPRAVKSLKGRENLWRPVSLQAHAMLVTALIRGLRQSSPDNGASPLPRVKTKHNPEKNLPKPQGTGVWLNRLRETMSLRDSDIMSSSLMGFQMGAAAVGLRRRGVQGAKNSRAAVFFSGWDPFFSSSVTPVF